MHIHSSGLFDYGGDVKCGITVDGELAYPAAPIQDVWQVVFAKVPV